MHKCLLEIISRAQLPTYEYFNETLDQRRRSTYFGFECNNYMYDLLI